MPKFTVLHNTKPFSRGTPSNYRAVASGYANADATDVAICDIAFAKTNSIEEAWFNRAAQTGLSDVVRTRSTSVGDVIKIADDDGRNERYYRCAAMGWQKTEAVHIAA